MGAEQVDISCIQAETNAIISAPRDRMTDSTLYLAAENNYKVIPVSTWVENGESPESVMGY